MRPLPALVSVAALSLLAVAGPRAGAQVAEPEGLKVSGDFRLRLEADWGSRRASGSARDDRNRARIRARLGLDYAVSEQLGLGVRLRSGSDDSQQSPHITILDFDGNPTGDADFNIDKWFAKAHWSGIWASAGRMSLPIWKPNELFWDDDVTPAGVAGGFDAGVGEASSLRLSTAYVSLPAGMRAFSGKLAMLQAVYSRSGALGFTVAGGLFDMTANPDDPNASLLLRGNGGRDYRIWVGNLQVRATAGGRTLSLGADVLHNSRGYSADDPDPVTAASWDQRDGWVLSATYGKNGKRGDWLAGYYYAHVEALAVNSSYAQDDWVRWGTPSQTRASDMRGHELRFVYAPASRATIVARLYLVDAITTQEDGNRFRVDLNVGF